MKYPSAADRLAEPVRPDSFRDYKPPQPVRRNCTARAIEPLFCTDDAERYHSNDKPRISQARAEARARLTSMASHAKAMNDRKSRQQGSS